MALQKPPPAAGRLFWIIGLTMGLISGAVVALVLAMLVTHVNTDIGMNNGRVTSVFVERAL